MSDRGLPDLRPAFRWCVTLIAIGLPGWLAVAGVGAADEPAAAEKERFFQQAVRPLLEKRCFTCHGGEKVKGGLRLSRRSAILQGGELGPAVDLEHPDESLLLSALNYDGLEMPPQGRLAAEEIAILKRWVEWGLPWSGPDDLAPEVAATRGSPAVDDAARQFWSFRPVARPPVPKPRDAQWVATPIDAFIRARLEDHGLTPDPPAERAALLRRAYFDLWGLPPTPEDVAAFEADHSPQAWERVVDRLLASPHYGERWGRHWLDLVRYAETNSYERDGDKPFVWRYRDYVIQSLNDDKPYDTFVVEQLAGDELQPRAPDQLVATGFYRLGIWDDEPSDVQQALYDDLDDIVSTTGQVFLGLTVNCARCHDHKLDPIPQRDYYRLLAFFAGVQRFGVRSSESVAEASLRSIASPQDVQRQAEEVAAHEAEVARVRSAMQAVEQRAAADFAPVEQEEFKNEAQRLPLIRKRVPKVIKESEFQQYRLWTEQLKRHEQFQPSALAQALCVTEIGPQPRDTCLLVRGNPRSRGEQVQPGFLSVLGFDDPRLPEPAPGATTCGRRTVLARWIASPENPLTARVIANRVWQYHFGRGLVRSPNNFGFQGDKPTHPDLLDWLADELIAQGWRLKPLHRLILLSNAYQMSSQGQPDGLAHDPDNDLFWRFDMRRLEGEELRDAILAVGGDLNNAMYGPSVFPVIEPEVLAGQSRPGSGWGESSYEDRCRRSVYIKIKRSLQVPLLAGFDAADLDTSCPVRFATTQPTQALTLLNGAFVNEQARVFAARAERDASPSTRDQVGRALELALQRRPSAAEVERGVAFVHDAQSSQGLDPHGALVQFCLLVLNLNEFLYLQ